MRLGFIGLGVMGAPMANHLLEAGHKVSVWNRTPSKAEPFRGKAEISESVESLAMQSDMILICVSRTEDVRSLTGRIATKSKPDTLIVDHSTIAPQGARTIGEALASKGIRFMDAPVTGGEKGAAAGTLTIFCGGKREDFALAKPFLDAYSKRAALVGELGSGQMMKMANQISVALSVLALCESMVFAEKSGLNLKEALDLIGSGAAGSWSFANYGPKILERDWRPGFAVDLQQKDLRYALETAKTLGLELPGAELTHKLFARLQQAGRGGDATPALFEVIEEKV